MVLDGKELEKGFDLNTIDPKTIESINVLKDASSTAMYGERGAHGVVLITTKENAKKDGSGRDTRDRREIDKPAAENDFNGALLVIEGEESNSARTEEHTYELQTRIG